MILIYGDVIMMTKQEQVINAKQVTYEIMNLIAEYGNSHCDHEPVTQTSHMVQCAMLAMQENADQELILCAFLHDIGRLLIQKKSAEAKGRFEIINQQETGVQYLKEKGFGERVYAVIEGLAAAKKYVTTDEIHSLNPSPADQKTFYSQSEPMTPEELEAFKKHPYFKEILQVRLWDENAKDPNAVLLPISVFKNYIEDYLSHRN